jgi:hypothetical protein
MDFYSGFRDGSVNDPKIEVAGNRNTVFVSLRLIQSRLERYESFTSLVPRSNLMVRPKYILDVGVASGTKGVAGHRFDFLWVNV